MTPVEFVSAGHKLYGRRHWVRELAKVLGVNVSTVRRLLMHEQIPDRYEVAVKGLLEQKRVRLNIMREVRRMRREQAKTDKPLDTA